MPLELVAESKLFGLYDSARVVQISALSNTVEDQLKAELALSKFNVHFRVSSTQGVILSSESQLNGYGDEEIKVLCDYGAENHAVPLIINSKNRQPVA